MSDLLNKKCEPCEGGVSAFDISEIHKYQKKVDGWDVVKKKNEIYTLEKQIFKDEAWTFKMLQFELSNSKFFYIFFIILNPYWFFKS